MAQVQFVGATRIYDGSSTPAVDHLDLDVDDGEFMALVGPPGSGKSTALRMLAGLEDVDDGEIRIAGVDVSHQPAKDRDLAMVFQNYALYPHMTVAENMGFALKLTGVSETERDERVREAAKLLDLEQHLERMPKALSGGQRQRVAMGRAIVREPSVFLMDEPLSNLDARLRAETRATITALQARLGTTTLYVTHDPAEALTIGHRVAVLKDGVLQQVDTPHGLQDRPANTFVAEFMASPPMNLRNAALVPGGASLGGVTVPLPAAIADAAARAGLASITLGLRPDALTLSTDPDALALTVVLVDEHGDDAHVHGSLPGDSDRSKYFVVRVDGPAPPRVGQTVHVQVHADKVHAFDPGSGERLG